MKIVTISLAVIVLLTVGACNVFKRSAAKTPPPLSPPVAVVPRMAPSVMSDDGIFVAGNAELAALQLKDKNVTMQTLLEGHKLYTGICTDCHQAKSIYSRPEVAWPGILTSMAKEANITNKQKDAIYKYVLAIKATQPK
jgi:hypothetical protein